MTTLILIGAISGVDNYREIFGKAAERLRAKGYEVINPANNFPEACQPPHRTGCDKCPTHEEAMQRSLLDIVLFGAPWENSGIATIQGWEYSTGAMLEHNVASAIGLPIKTVDAWVREARSAADT